MQLRIGQGYDVHAFAAAGEAVPSLVLGGVTVPHERGLRAHSDGDVLLHALCDALLGALALGDIGQHFPDTDPDYAGISSRQLLRRVVELVEARHYQLNNADMTVIAERPKLAPYIDEMRELIAADTHVTSDRISVKATTSEGLGFVGREEGIACLATVMLVGAS